MSNGLITHRQIPFFITTEVAIKVRRKLVLCALNEKRRKLISSKVPEYFPTLHQRYEWIKSLMRYPYSQVLSLFPSSTHYLYR